MARVAFGHPGRRSDGASGYGSPMRALLLSLLIVAACDPAAPPASPAPIEAPAVAEPPPPAPLPAEAARLDPQPETPSVVATWEGGALTAADVEARIGADLRAREIRFLLDRYETQSATIDALVTEALLRDEVARRGLPDVDALLRAEVEARVPEPTDADIEQLYPLMAPQLQGAGPDEARPLIVAELVRRASQRRQREFLDALRASAGVTVLLPYPDLPRVDVPVRPDDPTRGPAEAPVVIVEFAEYQCYYCEKARPVLERLASEYPDRVRIVWKDFPLTSHGRARPAATAARCAGEQGRYWEMSELLLRNQQALTEADIAGYARTIALSVEAFQRCLADGRHDASIDADVEDGRAVGVQVTPTFFVNGVMIAGAQPYERFQALVERELAR
jgi:protein-disulfide isomerase